MLHWLVGLKIVVEAIKDKKKIDALLMYLKGKSERDYLLCKFQLNTGLSISDVVGVRVGALMTPNMNFKDYFVLQEQKTGKEKKIKLNDSLKKALKAYRILKAEAINLNIEHFGTHSLRKTWGYWNYPGCQG